MGMYNQVRTYNKMEVQNNSNLLYIIIYVYKIQDKQKKAKFTVK